MNSKTIRISAIAALAVIASACQLRPLEDPNSSLELRINISVNSILNVHTSVYNKNIPVPEVNTDMMRVLFYDTQTHALITQAFISEKTTTETGEPCVSGTITIEPGVYDMVCYNFDTPDTFIKGENNLLDLESYTTKVSTSIKSQFMPSLPEGTEIYYEPDHVVVAREIGLEIRPHSTVLTIETDATTIIDSYYIQVCCKGLKYATNMSAAITGMTPSNKFGAGEPQTDKPCAVWFQLLGSQDSKIVGENQDVFCAVFNTYGKIYHSADGTKAEDDIFPEDSKLVITFNSTGSSETQVYTYDMNKLFLTEDALERHWLIINDTVVVPEPQPGGGGGGFTPVVDDWDDEKGEILI